MAEIDLETKLSLSHRGRDCGAAIDNHWAGPQRVTRLDLGQIGASRGS